MLLLSPTALSCPFLILHHTTARGSGLGASPPSPCKLWKVGLPEVGSGLPRPWQGLMQKGCARAYTSLASAHLGMGEAMLLEASRPQSLWLKTRAQAQS